MLSHPSCIVVNRTAPAVTSWCFTQFWCSLLALTVYYLYWPKKDKKGTICVFNPFYLQDLSTCSARSLCSSTLPVTVLPLLVQLLHMSPDLIPFITSLHIQAVQCAIWSFLFPNQPNSPPDIACISHPIIDSTLP